MSRNSELMESFANYCNANPTQRFWQALRNWSGHNFILVAQNKDEVKGQYEDTFYWEGLNKRKE